MTQQGSNSKDRIVQAADQLFYVHGYNQTSFSDIAAETGIPRGNFYYYFKTKDEILTAVLEYRNQQIEDMLEACDKFSDEPKEQLLYLVEVLIREEDNIIKYGCPMGTMSSELSKSSVDLQKQVTAIFETMRIWIDKKLASVGFSHRSQALSMEILSRLQG
ncbi:MAG: TetR/AcrR family transcriptional regulator, partial [Gammaproteobacteria bacterium]|nr:TetR/AcrR family transcriptional regulator [Gammaproteobacteria bacterium]